MTNNGAVDHGTALGEALRALKERTPHSFDVLAARLHISRSTLHRYCNGRSVPPDFATIELMAAQCQADEEEVARLHRLWLLARRSRTASSASASASASVPTPMTEAETGPEPDSSSPKWRPGQRSQIVAVVAAVLVLFGGVVWAAQGHGAASDTPEAGQVRQSSQQRLFSPACQGDITMGQHDDCVRQVQELLAATGVKIGVDGQFGPETLRRVTAFQVKAGISVDGIVGPETKKALYEKDISLRTWSGEKVARRIREVFTEDPDTAVRIADCQSFLDPLHILPNTDGSRNWGVFQISDHRLRDMRATPEEALDPEWNIQAAHRLWAQDEDFSDWAHCLAAAEPDKTPRAEE